MEKTLQWLDINEARTTIYEGILVDLFNEMEIDRETIGSAVDVGSGSGVSTKALSKAFPRAAITTIDPQDGLIELDHGHVVHQPMTLERYLSSENAVDFDVVLICTVDDIRFEDIARLVKSKGYLIELDSTLIPAAVPTGLMVVEHHIPGDVRVWQRQ